MEKDTSLVNSELSKKVLSALNPSRVLEEKKTFKLESLPMNQVTRTLKRGKNSVSRKLSQLKSSLSPAAKATKTSFLGTLKRGKNSVSKKLGQLKSSLSPAAKATKTSFLGTLKRGKNITSRKLGEAAQATRTGLKSTRKGVRKLFEKPLPKKRSRNVSMNQVFPTKNQNIKEFTNPLIEQRLRNRNPTRTS